MATFPRHIPHTDRVLPARVHRDVAKPEPAPRTTPAGDPTTLRGIPVIGVPGGHSGATPGTTPHAVRQPC